jgi:hypothetical protein
MTRLPFRARRSQRELSQREAIAYHEAGHAVIAWINNRKIIKITIDQVFFGEKGFVWGGLTHLVKERRSKLESELVIQVLAGPFAERLFLGHWGIGGVNDFERLNSIEWKTPWGFWAMEAQVKVQFYWPVIHELAVELLQAGTLRGKQAAAIIAAAMQRFQRSRKRPVIRMSPRHWQ